MLFSKKKKKKAKRWVSFPNHPYQIRVELGIVEARGVQFCMLVL